MKGRCKLGAAIAMALALGHSPAREASAQLKEGAVPARWIWHPTDEPQAETRYFRKSFRVKENGSKLALDVTADDRFTLFLDGKEVAAGRRLARLRQARRGEARRRPPRPGGRGDQRARRARPGSSSAGGVTPLGQVAPIHTDASWKSTDRCPTGDAWTPPGFDDSAWVKAKDLGPTGASSPVEGRRRPSRATPPAGSRSPRGSSVTTVAAPDVTGSAISFAFDPKGRPCVGIEQGPIARLIDADGDGIYEDRAVIAPQMKQLPGLRLPQGRPLRRRRGAGRDRDLSPDRPRRRRRVRRGRLAPRGDRRGWASTARTRSSSAPTARSTSTTATTPT